MKQKPPTVASRGLGWELRQLRRARRLTVVAVSQQLGWQSSKLSRMETGQQGIRPEEVAALLVVYGVIGAERKRLLGMAERSRERGLWEAYGAGLTPWSRTFIGFEREATRMLGWQPLLVPGLLQLPEYTRALMVACGIAENDADARVATRLARQAVLVRSGPPEVHLIVDEMVVRRVLGSPQLMARQLRHLVEATERPNVTIQVVPFAVGAHTGLDGPFVLFDFARSPSVVYLEHKLSSVFLEEENHVATFRQQADRLAEVALSPAESVEFVARVATEYERE